MVTITVSDTRNLAPDGQAWSWSWTGSHTCTAAMLIEERIRSESDRIRAGIGM